MLRVMSCSVMLMLFMVCSKFTAHIECQKVRPPLSEEQLKIAREYMDKLSSKKSNWIDPNDMFGGESNTYGKIKDEDSDAFELQQNKAMPDTATTASPGIHDTASALQDDLQQPSIVENESSKTKLDLGDATPDNIDMFFVSRWLRRFVSQVDKFADSSVSWRKLFTFSLTNTQVLKVKNILKRPKTSLIDVEEIVFDAFSDMSVTDEESVSSKLQDSFIRNDKIVFACIILVVLLALAYIMSCCPHPKTCVFVIIVVITVGFQWKQLYEEVLASKAAKLEEIDYPAACKKADFTFIESVQHYFKSMFVSRGTCTQYYETVLIDPLWDVSLMKAISLSFSKFIFAPLEAFAQTLNKVVKLLLHDLGPTEVFILFSFIFVFLLMTYNYKIRLPFFFASIEPSVSSAGPSLTSRVLSAISSSVVHKEHQICKNCSSHAIKTFHNDSELPTQTMSLDNSENKYHPVPKELVQISESDAMGEKEIIGPIDAAIVAASHQNGSVVSSADDGMGETAKSSIIVEKAEELPSDICISGSDLPLEDKKCAGDIQERNDTGSVDTENVLQISECGDT